MKATFNLILFITIIIKFSYPQQNNFFPIKIGNEYQTYNGYMNYYGSIERDSLYNNGKLYYLLPRPVFEFDYTRVDSEGNIYTAIIPFTGAEGEPGEYLIFKANALDGEIWPVAWNFGNPIIDTLFAKLLFTDTLFVFDRLRVIKSVLLYENEGPPYVFWLAEGIGKIRDYYDDGTIVNLNYAKINGEIYGNLVSVNERKNDLTLSFEISQNFPNPFNGQTSINVKLFNPFYETEIEIINILGERVYHKKIDHVQMQTIIIDSNEIGLNSGVYTYAVMHNKQIITKKFILLK